MHDEMMRRARMKGWDALRPDSAPHPHAEALKLDREAEAKRIAAFFGSAAGQDALEWLVSVCVLSPPRVSITTEPTAEAYAMQMAYREGQASVVRMILQVIDEAKEGESDVIERASGAMAAGAPGQR